MIGLITKNSFDCNALLIKPMYDVTSYWVIYRVMQVQWYSVIDVSSNYVISYTHI